VGVAVGGRGVGVAGNKVGVGAPGTGVGASVVCGVGVSSNPSGVGVDVRVGNKRGVGNGGNVGVFVGGKGVRVGDGETSVGTTGTKGVSVGVGVRVAVVNGRGVEVRVGVSSLSRKIGPSLLSMSAETAVYAPKQMISKTPKNAKVYARFSMSR
jgi:hypothetical protein